MRFVFCSLNIGSMAKQFTATTILLLPKDKKLAVDDDVHKYLTATHLINAGQAVCHESASDWAETRPSSPSAVQLGGRGASSLLPHDCRASDHRRLR